MAKRMTKAQRAKKADILLMMARHWQIGNTTSVLYNQTFLDEGFLWDVEDDRWFDVCASAALSEVCHGMGFDIE